MLTAGQHGNLLQQVSSSDIFKAFFIQTSKTWAECRVFLGCPLVWCLAESWLLSKCPWAHLTTHTSADTLVASSPIQSPIKHRLQCSGVSIAHSSKLLWILSTNYAFIKEWPYLYQLSLLLRFLFFVLFCFTVTNSLTKSHRQKDVLWLIISENYSPS